MIDLQKICVKVHLSVGGKLDPDPLLAIFHRWKADAAEDLVDLADYAHIPEGPVVALIGRRYNLTIDTTGGQPGIQYCSKKGLEGDLRARLTAVLRAALERTQRLLAEPEFPRGAKAQAGSLEVTINDRLLAPNDEVTDAAMRPALEAALNPLFGASRYYITRDADASRRLSYSVKAAHQEPTLEGLLARLR